MGAGGTGRPGNLGRERNSFYPQKPEEAERKAYAGFEQQQYEPAAPHCVGEADPAGNYFLLNGSDGFPDEAVRSAARPHGCGVRRGLYGCECEAVGVPADYGAFDCRRGNTLPPHAPEGAEEAGADSDCNRCSGPFRRRGEFCGAEPAGQPGRNQ